MASFAKIEKVVPLNLQILFLFIFYYLNHFDSKRFDLLYSDFIPVG